jgi:hypothetical protein
VLCELLKRERSPGKVFLHVYFFFWGRRGKEIGMAGRTHAPQETEKGREGRWRGREGRDAWKGEGAPSLPSRSLLRD